MSTAVLLCTISASEARAVPLDTLTGGGMMAQTTCLTPLAEIVSPTPGSTLPAGAVTFEWCNASADYFLTIESVPGAHDIFFAFVNVTSITLGHTCNVPSPTSPTIQCIPDLGETIYVTLWTQTGSGKTFQAAPTVTYTAANSCLGDCDSGGAVAVNELVQMVNIALGNADISTCLAGDANSDGEITVNEIVAGVNNALNGCPTGS
jgi:hypothetical protein